MQRPGFILAEILLALAISAMVGVGVILMLTSIAKATNSREDLRKSILREQAAAIRCGTLERCALMVLENSSDHLVLWRDDRNLDGKPNISELLRIDFNAQKNELLAYTAPTDLDSSSDIDYELDADFGAVTVSLINQELMVGRVCMTHVQQWEVTLDNSDMHAARLLDQHITLDELIGRLSLDIVSALRASSV